MRITTPATNPDTLPRPRHQADASAANVLSLLLLLAVAAFCCWLVGTRSLDIGTDTETYAGLYLRLGSGLVETRLEPGFVYLSYGLRQLGLGVIGYQTVLFALLLATAVAAARRYFLYLGGAAVGYYTFLSASLMLLLVSPMFVNASINAIRQGLAALLIFASLLAFHQRHWWKFALYGALASGFHISALLYLVLAPVLLLPSGMQRFLAAAAFLLYISGLSRTAVSILSPAMYQTVMEYTATIRFEAGVRIDFAVFSIFWYVLPYLLSPLIKARYREKILDSTAVYLVMVLPFFAVGWGYFSNRYLLPAWLAVSLILAAILCSSRLSLPRQPLLIRFGLIAACVVFYVLVSRGIVI